MKVMRKITIEKNDLVRFLMKELDIKAHLVDINCTAETDRSSSGDLESISLEWTEGHALSETWNR